MDIFATLRPSFNRSMNLTVFSRIHCALRRFSYHKISKTFKIVLDIVKIIKLIISCRFISNTLVTKEDSKFNEKLLTVISVTQNDLPKTMMMVMINGKPRKKSETKVNANVKRVHNLSGNREMFSNSAESSLFLIQNYSLSKLNMSASQINSSPPHKSSVIRDNSKLHSQLHHPPITPHVA